MQPRPTGIGQVEFAFQRAAYFENASNARIMKRSKLQTTVGQFPRNLQKHRPSPYVHAVILLIRKRKKMRPMPKAQA